MNKILFKLIEGKGKFFLMRDVPEQPKESDYRRHRSPGFNDFITADSNYAKAYQNCISEAIKNGEIVNPEVMPINNDGKFGFSLQYRTGYLKDGDTFDLPEGMGFEEFKHRPGNKWIEAVRLLPEKPVQKEESQEELFSEFMEAVRSFDWKSKFTIKRKES